MARRQITCAEADALRAGLAPHSSCTNFVGGEVLTWGANGVDILDEVLDADGCRHYRLDGGGE
jgi:hypothetical protein